MKTTDLYVSLTGNDTWSGKLMKANKEGTDGPLATLQGALKTVREQRAKEKTDAPFCIWMDDGYYELDKPVIFTDSDSQIDVCAYPGKRPVLSGGRKISGWKVGEISGIKMWYTYIPEAASGKWHFKQLFVNGERRYPDRYPKEGWHYIESVPGVDFRSSLLNGTDRFVCKEGDIKPWTNMEDVTVVILHYWTEERINIKSFDERTNTVELSQKSVFVLKDDVREKYARYYVENVFEELKEPGEWYLNKKTGMLYYIPKEGEDPENTEVIVPYLEHILILQGSPEEGRYIHNVGFTGIQFSFTENDRTEVLYTREDKERWLQAAFDVSAAIHVMGAKECSFRECKVNRTGGYGIELSYGCTDNLIAGNEISDMGAGGIKINGADANGPACKRTGKNKITDNRIFNGGHIFHSGVGICSMHSFKNIIAHNDIQDLYYSGISCGWIWGYHDNISRENIIEKNHIHHLGKGLLSDMGGIYLLGIQPGTVVRGNLIHDIEKCNYGGWAIYTDEGCSHVLIENNICYDTNSQVFDQHYGRENIVRNNIFAFGEEGVVRLLRNEGHKQFSFYRNILITNGKPVFIGAQEKVLEKGNFFSDLNLFYDMSQKEPFCWIQKGYSFKEFSDEDKIMMRQWNDLDYDRHSLICDPLFKDIQNRDFALHSNSPAFDLGFQPIDNSDAGPREDYENSLHLDKKTDEEWRA
jgi:hypothetical protein